MAHTHASVFRPNLTTSSPNAMDAPSNEMPDITQLFGTKIPRLQQEAGYKLRG